MKILHIFNELKFSGAEIMYVDAAPLFQEMGCKLTAMSTAPNLGEYAPHFERAGYKVLHKPYPGLKNYLRRIQFFLAFIRSLKEENFDVVHIHRSDAMWGISFCSWIAGTRSVYTFHNVFSTQKITRPYYIVLRWTAKNIFNCRFQSISDSVDDNELKRFKNKTLKINNWYGNKRFYPPSQTEKQDVRKDLAIPSESLVIISIGGCSLIKRHSEIIKALPEIIKYCKDTIYLHLGEGCTEKEEKLLAEELGVSNHIRFCGNQTNVRKYLIASDIYIMPSKFEGISLTTIEAMACGVPAILYDVPGLRDFQVGGETCFLIPEDYNLLSIIIKRMTTNPEMTREIAETGNKFVKKHYTMENNVQQIYQLYERKK